MLNETVRYGGLLVKRGAMYQDLEAQKVKGPAWLRYGDLPALEEEAEYWFNPETGDFHQVGSPADAPGVAPAAPTYGDFTVSVDAPARCCPRHDNLKGGDPRHWWLKPGMSPETADAICLAVNGDGGSRWRKVNCFASRTANWNKRICGKSLRAALKPTKNEVPSEHFRFTFCANPEPKRTAKVCGLMAKMGVGGDVLTFTDEERDNGQGAN